MQPVWNASPPTATPRAAPEEPPLATDCLADHPARAPGARLPPRHTSSLAAARPVQEAGLPARFCHCIRLHWSVPSSQFTMRTTSGTAEPALCPWPGPGNTGACGLVPAPIFLSRQLLACSTHTVDNSFPDPVLSQGSCTGPQGLRAQDHTQAKRLLTAHRP